MKHKAKTFGFIVISKKHGATFWCDWDRTLYTATRSPVSVFADRAEAYKAIRHAARYWSAPRFEQTVKPSDYYIAGLRRDRIKPKGVR